MLTLSREGAGGGKRWHAATFQIDLNVQLLDLRNVALILDHKVAGIANVLYKHCLPQPFNKTQPNTEWLYFSTKTLVLN